ncbi:serine hydrolase [Azospirillum sp. ST 5-10]
MRGERIGVGLAIAAVIGLAVPARADATDPLRDLVAQVAEQRLAEAGHGGLVVGVVRDGRSLVVGLGSTGWPGSGPPDGRTVFQIASLTKPFTGTILAELIRSGRVAPSDPLRRHLQSAARVPDFQGRPIRLVDLATHTAGLPNVPETPNFSWARLADPRNPYKPLTPAEVDRWLAGYELSAPPGTRFSYSNVGMAVLGEALEQVTQASYAELLRRTVTERFGLHDTTLTLDADQRARKAVGHARGQAVPDWEAPAMQPAFGLYSTADDLVRWLRVNMGDCPGGCPAAAVQTLALAQSVQVEGPALADPGSLGQGAMALGWFVAWAQDGSPIFWHSGATGGFNTYIAFSRAHRWGVVALNNSDPARVVADRTAIDLLRLFEADRPERLERRPARLALRQP